MWPTLVSIGPIAISSFGFSLVLGMFFGGFGLWKKGKEEGFEEEFLMDGWLTAGVAALVAGRIWYVLEHWQDFSGSVYKMLFLTKFPGIAYEGALTGAMLGLLIFALKKRWDAWQVMEISVFSFLIVEMFGWWGSFLGGGSLGRETGWFWGLSFPGVEGRRHPVQLVWLISLLVVYKLMKKWEKEYRGFKWYQGAGEAKTGFLVFVYCLFLGVLKMGLGFLSEERVGWWFSGGLIVLAGLLLVSRLGIKLGIRAKKEQEARLPKEKTVLKLKKASRKKQGFDFK